MADNKEVLKHSRDLVLKVHRDAMRILGFLNREVAPCLQGPFSNSRSVVMVAVYSRALAWAFSIEKWTTAIHFQSTASGTRALLEITSDMIRLSNDSSPDTETRIREWADSAKLKSAEALLDYFNNRAKKNIPARHSQAQDFVAENRERILKRRAELEWTRIEKGKTKIIHPSRWTNQNLLYDIRKADSLAGNMIIRHLGVSLEEFYETEYQSLCWQVHGSGVTDVLGTNASHFNYAVVSGIFWCSCLIMLCTEIILDEFGRIGVRVPRNVLIEADYLSAMLVDRRLDLLGE